MLQYRRAATAGKWNPSFANWMLKHKKGALRHFFNVIEHHYTKITDLCDRSSRLHVPSSPVGVSSPSRSNTLSSRSASLRISYVSVAIAFAAMRMAFLMDIGGQTSCPPSAADTCTVACVCQGVTARTLCMKTSMGAIVTMSACS